MTNSMKEDLKRLEWLRFELDDLELEVLARSYMEDPVEIAHCIASEARQRARVNKEIREITDWFMVWAPEYL